jgi:ketosteroid isomerase-like protein
VRVFARAAERRTRDRCRGQRDAAALASLYADDARFLPPNMEPSEGRSSIQGAMQMLLDMGARSVDVEPLDAAKREISRSSTAATRWGSSPRAKPQ